ARSSQNAIKHGLRSERPVLPTEDPAEWDAFHADLVQFYAPANTIERELVDRIALQMWRQRRAAHYEVEAASDVHDGVLADAEDGRLGLDQRDPEGKQLWDAFRRDNEKRTDVKEWADFGKRLNELPTLAEAAAVE